MRLCLINPLSPQVQTGVGQQWFNRYRIWKPLGLLSVAALTPPDWQLTVLDENHLIHDYAAMPRPDLVGITGFSSQAARAYELAARFRAMGVRVVMGGIHASMCPQEALDYVDSVVIGEAEGLWATVLADAQQGTLKKIYQADAALAFAPPPARHDLLPADYAFGAIQTTRGCPLNCTFCSVTAFNGARYRHRPVADVVQEMRLIREKLMLIVDDNLIGTSAAHVSRAKELFRAMIEADLGKQWIAQVTVNIADDDELLRLAAQAGCAAVFIGFESPSAAGLAEIGKKFNAIKGRDMRASVRRIHRRGILVVGSFIIGLDADGPGVGRRVADAASSYGVDILSATYLTPLPGTRLWETMQAAGRIDVRQFPQDWQYYTFTFPVSRFKQLSQAQIIYEMEACDRRFYSPWRIMRRVGRSFWHFRRPIFALVGNLGYRSRLSANHQAYRQFVQRNARGQFATMSLPAVGADIAPPGVGAAAIAEL